MIEPEYFWQEKNASLPAGCSVPTTSGTPVPLALHSVDWSCLNSTEQVTTSYDILSRLLKFYYKWRQLHQFQLPDRRPWWVYSSFSFQILLSTILLNTAVTQVVAERIRKDNSLSCRSRRRNVLDGLMVQYINGDHRRVSDIFYYRLWRQATSSCVGNLSVMTTTAIAYMLHPMEDIW